MENETYLQKIGLFHIWARYGKQSLCTYWCYYLRLFYLFYLLRAIRMYKHTFLKNITQER